MGMYRNCLGTVLISNVSVELFLLLFVVLSCLILFVRVFLLIRNREWDIFKKHQTEEQLRGGGEGVSAPRPKSYKREEPSNRKQLLKLET